MVWSVGLRSYLEVVSVAKSIRRVVLLARKYNIHLTIRFYYVSLRTRILGQAPFLNRKSNHQAKGRNWAPENETFTIHLDVLLLSK